MTRRKESARSRRQVVLDEHVTLREMIALLRAANTKREVAERLLEFLDLLPAADRPCGGYSRGMRRKTAIALALIGDPEALLLDEPTDGLDPDGARRFTELLAELKRRGRAVVIASHILPLIEKRCDRVGILDRGTLVAQGTLAELRLRANEPDADLERLFLVLTGREERDATGLLG